MDPKSIVSKEKCIDYIGKRPVIVIVTTALACMSDIGISFGIMFGIAIVVCVNNVKSVRLGALLKHEGF